MSSVFDVDCIEWSDAVAAGSGTSAQNASECVAEITIENRVDEGVGSERQKWNHRCEQLHGLGDLQSCHSKHASQDVGKEETDEADQNDHGGAGSSMLADQLSVMPQHANTMIHIPSTTTLWCGSACRRCPVRLLLLVVHFAAHHLVPDTNVDDDDQRTADHVHTDLYCGLVLGPLRGFACCRIRPDEAKISGPREQTSRYPDPHDQVPNNRRRHAVLELQGPSTECHQTSTLYRCRSAVSRAIRFLSVVD